MYKPAARLSAAVAIAVVGIYYGLALARYADADDAPGGVVIGMALMFGSLALGIWLALRRPGKPS